MVVSLIVGALASTAAVGGSAVAKASVGTGLVGLSCGAVGKGAFAVSGASAFGHGASAGAFASVPAWGFGHGISTAAYASVPAWGFGHRAFAVAYAGVPAWGFVHGVPCAPFHFVPPPPLFLP